MTTLISEDSGSPPLSPFEGLSPSFEHEIVIVKSKEQQAPDKELYRCVTYKAQGAETGAVKNRHGGRFCIYLLILLLIDNYYYNLFTLKVSKSIE